MSNQAGSGFCWVEQWCIHGGRLCGDGCPHFGEPQPEHNGPSFKIKICHGTALYFEPFTDERTDNVDNGDYQGTGQIVELGPDEVAGVDGRPVKVDRPTK